MTKQCTNCYYYDVCNDGTICDDHTPIDDASVDSAITELIESGRHEFHSEWAQYISSFND